MAGKLVAGFSGRRLGMSAGEVLGCLGIASQNGFGDGAVLAPDDGGALGGGENEAHRAHELWPLLGDGAGDLRVAGKRVNGAVEGDVGLDQTGDGGRLVSASIGGFEKGFAGGEGVGEGGAFGGGGAIRCAAFCREAGGEAIENGADLVEGLDAAGFEGSYGEAAAAVFDKKTAPLQDL